MNFVTKSCACTQRFGVFRRYSSVLFGVFGGLLAVAGQAGTAEAQTPGDTLTLEVAMDQLGGTAGKGSGTAKVDGQLACQASLFFVIVEG